MARFYGSMGNGRGSLATKTGTPNSGLEAHIRGWDVGVMVSARDNRDEDLITIYSTGGSNESAPMVEIGKVRLVNGAPVFEANARATWDQVR